MRKTQIQLPDNLYDDLKAVAEHHEWSLADALRRGAEYIVRIYYPEARVGAGWKPPVPGKLGRILMSPDKLREQAYDSSGEE